MEKQNIISTNSMDHHTKNQLLRELLYGISLDDLHKLVDLKKKMHSISTPRKPIPTPRKSVKQMVQEYEDNIILPPLEFRDDYKPRTKKPVPLPRTKKPISKPVPLPRTKIEETDKALKGYTSSYKISIKHSTDPLLQLQNTRKAVEYHILRALSAMKGLKFIETLKVTFSKAKDDGLIYKSAFFNSKPQTVINNLSISESLQTSKQQILNFVAQWISEGSGWTIRAVNSHFYQPCEI